jgi:hypothetical protein
MTYKEVISLIGPPLSMERPIDNGRYVPMGDGAVNQGTIVLTYSDTVWAWSYPMLWVTLADGIVVSIYAKQGEMGAPGDLGVYLYRAGELEPWIRHEEFHSLFRR